MMIENVKYENTLYLFIGGLMRAGGVLFIKFENKFHQSAADTAWAVSLSTTLRFLLGTHAFIFLNLFNYCISYQNRVCL